MAFPAWIPPTGPGAGAAGLAPSHEGEALRPGWEDNAKGSGSPDTASSFLKGVRSQFGSMVPQGQAEPTTDWEMRLKQLQSSGVLQQMQQQQTQQQYHPPQSQQLQPQPQPQQQHPQPHFMPPQHHQPQPQPTPQVHQAVPEDTASVQHHSPNGTRMPQLLTEEEFQCNSAIEFGSGISMNGCTIDRHLNDGDPMPKLEPLSSSVSLRITPTNIIFLHHYDRNPILEVPISELYEVIENYTTKNVLLHTRNANGSALLELICTSSRKRLAIYKTLGIRKNALERLKRQQNAITRAYHSN
eukprot:TRINITY_DN7198_c0_g1_i2.p1 TRINITY_DN7198_c0_g1~~TRINITY_DN7198_c0_g1_i2.p1  ORF type:complete len:299 (+),score=47.69 TRINITY_DN7198_c0_g1_i2:53-949(+)